MDSDSDPKTLPRLEARLAHLIRAEEVFLERFPRGLITDTVLDEELARLTKDRVLRASSRPTCPRVDLTGAPERKGRHPPG